MSESVKSFMYELIDYAGLFPPAKLPLETAIHNYATYIQERYQWILSRFIIPASQIRQLQEFKGLFSKANPLRLSVLLKVKKTASEFYSSLQHELKEINWFLQEFGDMGRVEAIELKVPLEVLQRGRTAVLDFVTTTRLRLDASVTGNYVTFFEAPFNESWNRFFLDLIIALSQDNETFEPNHYQNGSLKIRTGGPTADLFPDTYQIAEVIQAAIQADVPLKATAGLHHPFRRFDESVQTTMHGFLNVFGACILGKKFKLARQLLIEIINEEDPQMLRFDDNGITWNDFNATSDEIALYRQQFAIGYGSCSFDEPIEDLKALNLL